MYLSLHLINTLFLYLMILFFFNRYRAFRRASDMRSNVYVTCCKMCNLGRVEAISGFFCWDFGAIRVYPGAILGIVGAILEPLWEVLGVLGSTLGLRVRGLGFDHHNAYLLEMQTSLSPYACAAKTLDRKTKMSSSIEIAYLVNMHKSPSPYACAATYVSM